MNSLNDYKVLVKEMARKEEVYNTYLENARADKARIEGNLMAEYGFKVDEEVTLHLLEFRDDSVSAFGAEQTVNCHIKGLYIDTDSEGEYIIMPRLHMMGSNKKIKKAPIHQANVFKSWEVLRNGEVILKNEVPNTIIEGKYTPDELEKTRSRCKITQKIS